MAIAEQDFGACLSHSDGCLWNKAELGDEKTNRDEVAESAWRLARDASALRHAAIARGERRAAQNLARIKKTAILRVIELLPDQIKVTLDDDFQIGLLSIRWAGHGRLHLPADTEIPLPAPAS